MSIAQVKAARRRMLNDKRFKPASGSRMSKSVRKALALRRKGQPNRSVGFH